MNERKIVIIGSPSNYNELGLVRSFGECGIRPYGIIICSARGWKRDWLHHSKYWKKVWRVDNAEIALKLLIDQFGHEKEKTIVTTPVDYVMQIIDDRYDELSEKFLLQNMRGKQGLINFYANKLEQAHLTKEMGFKTLDTKIVDVIDFSDRDLEEKYPILLKPVAGGEGSKDDITICRTREDYTAAVKMLKSKDYRRILCQKYLEHRREIIAYGALSRESALCSYTILENIRQWPLSYGVGSFGKLVTDRNVIDYVHRLYTSIMQMGYDGPIDTEIFQDLDTGEFYLNEFNWRPGGRNFTSLGTRVYSIVLWYYGKIGFNTANMSTINSMDGFTQNDVTDFSHVLAGNITFADWRRAFRSSCSHASWNWKDLGPCVLVYGSMIKAYCKKLCKL